MNFETGSDGIQRTQDQVSASFPITIERHDRAAFQKAGHFVPGMVDANGFRREWDGALVFVGTLNYELRDASGNVTDTRQVLRVLADTPDELRRVLSNSIRETFFGLWAASNQQADIYVRYRKQVDDNVELQQWIAATLPDFDPKGSASDVARRAVGFLVMARAERDAAHEKLRRVLDPSGPSLSWWRKILGGAK